MKEKTIGCSHFTRCSGCSINSCETPPEIFEQARRFFDGEWAITLRFKQGDCRHYRSRAKLAVRAPALIGLFEKGSHRVLAIPHCQVHHPRINQAISLVLDAFRTSGLTAYDETTHLGDLRYLQCVVERRTGRVQLSLVLNMRTATQAWSRFAKELYACSFWHSIWFNFNNKPTNTIFGPHWEKIIGEEVIWEQIAGHEIAFGPSHFGQANLQMYEKLIVDIQQNVMPNATICELFAGIGVISLALAEKSLSVRLCEVEKHAKHFFDMANKRLPPTLQNKLSYHVGRVEECFELLQEAEVCVVDPPRKGLGETLLKKILTTPTLKQLIYVSCEWKSLERDLRTIRTKYPDWKVKDAISYLFFPGTNQIETVAFLERQTKESG